MNNKKMKISVKISKLHNLFFFVSNLTECNVYNNPAYNKKWLANNSLNDTEILTLKTVSGVFKKYELNKQFASEKDPNGVLKEVTKIIKPKKLVILKNALDLFAPRFERIWKKEEKNLIAIKREIENTFIASQELIDVLCTVYDQQPAKEGIDFFLLTNPVTKRIVSGGSGLGDNRIELECSKITKTNNKNNFLTRVALHEIIHIAFEQKIKEKINKYVESPRFKNTHEKILKKTLIFKQIKSFPHIIKEMIDVSMLPEGYLGEKFFNANTHENIKKRKCIKMCALKKEYYDLMLFSLWYLYADAKYYCDEKKPINVEFFEKAISIWEKFEETDLSKFKPK